MDAQNILTGAVLAKCEGREELKEVFKKLVDYPKQGVPYKRGGMAVIMTFTPACITVSAELIHNSHLLSACCSALIGGKGQCCE